MKNKRAFSRYLPIALALLGVLLLAAFLILKKERPAEAERSKEYELSCFLSQGKGVGKASVTLCYAADGQTVTGAAVVCAGGNDPTVRAEVTRLLCAALGIGANRVFVSAAEPETFL